MHQKQVKKWGLKITLVITLIGISTLAQAASFDQWLEFEQGAAMKGLFNNISPKDGNPGAVVASPSRNNPNYYFHWVRDAALVTHVIVQLYQNTKEHSYYDMILNYISFSRSNQLTPNRSGGLGEPKFNVDGSAFNGDWGRPQNDGPALRAITLIHFAKELLSEGKEEFVRALLYDNGLPAQTVIKTDLEFVSHHWKEASFDLWEEVLGDHFYTRMVQRRALLDGAELARMLGDHGAADWYEKQGLALEESLFSFWDKNRKILVTTLNQSGGLQGKTSDLDVAVILGVLHGYRGDGFLSPTDDRVLATAATLESAFKTLYSINGQSNLGTAIGRYPEDHYDGYTTSSQGNPWVLATAALAEFYYKAGDPKKGDAFLKRLQYHSNPDGSLSEQMNRDSGFMQGAGDLTWSYASFLTALFAKEKTDEMDHTRTPQN